MEKSSESRFPPSIEQYLIYLSVRNTFKPTVSYVSCTELYVNETVSTTNLGDFDGGCAYIASPFYPARSYQNSFCVWSFVASDTNNVIQLEFIDYDFESVRSTSFKILHLLILSK